MSDTVLVEREIEIDAPREIVFELLTEARGLLEWMAVEAESDVVVGGRLWWRHENGAVMRGRFVEIDPPRRVVFTYGWEAGGPDVPPESTRVEIELSERDGVTTLRLSHHLLPAEVANDHRQGWEWFLKKLAERSLERNSRRAEAN